MLPLAGRVERGPARATLSTTSGSPRRRCSQRFPSGGIARLAGGQVTGKVSEQGVERVDRPGVGRIEENLGDRLDADGAEPMVGRSDSEDVSLDGRGPRGRGRGEQIGRHGWNPRQRRDAISGDVLEGERCRWSGNEPAVHTDGEAFRVPKSWGISRATLSLPRHPSVNNRQPPSRPRPGSFCHSSIQNPRSLEKFSEQRTGRRCSPPFFTIGSAAPPPAAGQRFCDETPTIRSERTAEGFSRVDRWPARGRLGAGSLLIGKAQSESVSS